MSPTKTSKKTWQRGADNQQAMDSAPRRKTNLTKSKPRTNEAIAQTTQVKQTDEYPKTQDETPKTTVVQGQKRKQTSIALAKQIRSESMQCS